MNCKTCPKLASKYGMCEDCMIKIIEGHTIKGLNTLRDEALRIAVEHGFKDATVGEEIALMHSELSEALEAYREGKKVNEVYYEHKTQLPGMPVAGAAKPCGIPSEMADVIIRVLHFCGKHEIDIEKAVIEKMKYNESRPFMHGKKL